MGYKMNKATKRCISWLLIVCLLPWMTGCESLTGRLWSSDLGENNYQAAREPDLKLSQTADHKDLLVEYDEVRSNDTKIRHRAYLLHANEEIITSGKKPRFLTARAATIVQGDPLTISYATDLTLVGDSTLRAVLAENKHHFTLVSNGREIELTQLPDYTQHNPCAQVALTPATVTGDVIICASVVGIFVLYVYCQNNPSVNVH